LYEKSVRGFDNDFVDFSRDMLMGARIDVFPKKGKQGGAFASYRK
jgi:oligoendopeptidase F